MAASTEALPKSSTLSTAKAPPMAREAFLAKEPSLSLAPFEALSTSLVSCDVSARNLATMLGPEAIALPPRGAVRPLLGLALLAHVADEGPVLLVAHGVDLLGRHAPEPAEGGEVPKAEGLVGSAGSAPSSIT